MAYDTTTTATDNLTDNLAQYHNELKTAVDHVMSASAYSAYSNVQSMTGNVTLSDTDFPIQSFAPTAARDLTLPAVASTNHAYFVMNTSGTYTITVKNAGASTITSVTPGNAVMLFSDGVVWKAAGASLSDGDKGDITVSINGATWTIDNDAVTFAKFQNITDARLLGRSAGSDGDMQEITVGTGLSLSAGALTATGGGDMVMLADSTLGSSAANFDLTSISGSYKHLRLVYSLRSDEADTNDEIRVRVNNDSGSNYDYFIAALFHNGQYSTVEGLGTTYIWASTCAAGTAPTSSFGQGYIDFNDYTSTTSHKFIHTRGGVRSSASSGGTRLYDGAAAYKATPAAITRLTIYPGVGTNFIAGSRVTLYGMK